MILLGGCAHSDDPQAEQEALTKKIESRIKLPDGAGQLASYGRNYAFAEDGTVIAAFVAPYGPSDAKAGKSRWHDSYEDLPMILDGGCSVISVKYYPETEDVIASCSGSA